MKEKSFKDSNLRSTKGFQTRGCVPVDFFSIAENKGWIDRLDANRIHPEEDKLNLSVVLLKRFDCLARSGERFKIQALQRFEFLKTSCARIDVKIIVIAGVYETYL